MNTFKEILGAEIEDAVSKLSDGKQAKRRGLLEKLSKAVPDVVLNMQVPSEMVDFIRTSVRLLVAEIFLASEAVALPGKVWRGETG